MSKDVKITVNKKLLLALHGKVHLPLEEKLSSIASSSTQMESSSIESDAAFKPRKKAISIRLDADVLSWFKAQPGKYQKHINQVCRAYMNAQKKQIKRNETAVALEE